MFGKGFYSLSDVARYTGVPTSTVRTWFRWRPDGRGHGPLFESDYKAVDSDYAVSFLNLIDAYVAAFFRSQGVPPPLIRRAYSYLRQDLQTEHPFAHAHLCTDGRRIIRKTAGAVNDPELIDVVSKQKLFSQMSDYLRRIDYIEATKLAGRWNISDGVVIDPRVSFGNPVIQSTGVTTLVLARQYEANRRDAALVADLFAVNESDVMNAVRFEAGLRHSHRRRAA